MAIALSDHEAAPRHKGDYPEELARLQRRLAQAQLALAVAGRRAMVVVEGWEAAGKAGVIRRIVAPLDPRSVRAHAIGAPSAEERARHHLQRFWARLPADGEIALFTGSWYRRVLAERVQGAVDRALARKAMDEINEFEAQQTDSGTLLVKLFLHVPAAEQERRLRQRLERPWQRALVRPEALRSVTRRPDCVAAAEEMLAHTDTRWAPWRVIDAGQKKFARLAALTHVAEAIEKKLPATPPPPDPALARWSRETLGMELG
jgi:AMP-polyphosphate phosphotransferase